MSMSGAGAALGLVGALGLLLVCARAMAYRRPSLELRLAPYLRDVPAAAHFRPAAPSAGQPVLRTLLGPPIQRAAGGLERVLGGASSVRRRLDRAGSPSSLQQFRAQQVVWGVAGFAAAAALGVLLSSGGRGQPVALLLMCAAAAVAGVVLRDSQLSASVRRREERMLAEFPTVADLLALSVAAGEGPVAALDRVVRTCRGELSAELARVLGAVRSGTSVAAALDALARRTGLPVVARFAEGFAVALDRGTPLAEVLHAQAADVREAGRRALIETGARKEVAMMVPVVFLVLPVTVLFAFYPGYVGLSFTTP
jgi:tight adherence protein C